MIGCHVSSCWSRWSCWLRSLVLAALVALLRFVPWSGSSRLARSMIATVITVVIVMAIVAPGADAQSFDHAGSYAFVPDTGQLPLIKQAVDRGVSGMLPTPKRIARHQLMDANHIPGVLRVIIMPDSVGTQPDSGKAMTLPRSGETIRWDDGNGHVCKARETVVADTLTQYCDAGSGQSAYQYIFEDGMQRLRMVVHITSPHLGGPVDYALEFHP